MKKLLLCFLIFQCAISFSQEVPEKTAPSDSDSTVYDLVSIEKPASFPGGDSELNSFLSKNIKYPEIARKNKVEGKVFISFVIDKKGVVTKIKIMKGVNVKDLVKNTTNKKKQKKYLDAAKALEEEALRVVRMMPDWIPAEQKGKNVMMRFILPLSYKLP